MASRESHRPRTLIDGRRLLGGVGPADSDYLIPDLPWREKRRHIAFRLCLLVVTDLVWLE